MLSQARVAARSGPKSPRGQSAGWPWSATPVRGVVAERAIDARHFVKRAHALIAALSGQCAGRV